MAKTVYHRNDLVRWNGKCDDGERPELPGDLSKRLYLVTDVCPDEKLATITEADSDDGICADFDVLFKDIALVKAADRPKEPSKKVLAAAEAIVKELNAFLKKNKMCVMYDMAGDSVYLLPATDWENEDGEVSQDDCLQAMAAGKVLDKKDCGRTFMWVRGSYVEEEFDWYCKKEASNG